MRYKILRFYQDKPAEIIRKGLTLKEAKWHCRDERSSGDEWFVALKYINVSFGVEKIINTRTEPMYYTSPYFGVAIFQRKRLLEL